MHKISFTRGASALALAIAATGTASTAFAQAGEAKSEEVIVTGSHLGKSAFSSPTPVNVIGDDRMKALANPSLADTLNQIPSFRAFNSPSTAFFRVTGNIGARVMDLRGLGPTRSLVLLDGRRIVPSSDNGTVDMNSIPSSLVKRAEVVTGGASAAYGADAVSGVVNVILDTKFTGVKTDFSAGVSQHNGDGQNYFASFAAGQDFAGGKGHWIFGAEAQKERGISLCRKRDWCNDHHNYPVNPGFSTDPSKSNGLPQYLNRDNVQFVYSQNPNISGYNVGSTAYGQQLTSANQMVASLKNKGLDANGNLTNFTYGDYYNGTFMIGGDQAVDQPSLWGYGGPIVTPTKHASMLGHVDFDLTDRIQFSSELMIGSVTGRTYGGRAVFANTSVSIDNPFISDATRTALKTAVPGITSISINVVHPEIGIGADGTSNNTTYRGVMALNGNFDTHDLKWDVSYEYGETDGIVKVKQNRVANFDGTGGANGYTAEYKAIDAITPPAGYNGPIYTTRYNTPVICRSSVTNTNQYNGNGCLPADIIGTLSSDAVAKYWKSAWAERTEKQNAFAANLRGTIANLPAGPLTGAVGVEYRKDSAVGPVDALSKQGVFQGTQWTELPLVQRDVKEAYIETSIPILANQPFAKNLTVDGARRWTDYSTSGAANTWKAGLVYEPNDQILVRLTQSSDIRAPTAAELNPNTSKIQSPLADPFAGGTRNIFFTSGGNPNLKNEESVTKTAGVVLKPSFLPGFRISTDYYNIKVAKAIDSFSGQGVINACYQQNLLCNLIVWNGAAKSSAGVQEVLGTTQNLSKLHAEGAEVVANYNFDALGGNFDATFNGNYVIDLSSTSAIGLKSHFDGATGNFGQVSNITGVPQYKLDGVLTYSRENWSVTAHGRYVPESKIDANQLIGPEDAGYSVYTAGSIESNRVSSAAYLDLSGTFNPKMTIFGGKTQLYGSVNNVFDKDPPEELRFIGNGIHYDPYGRAFRLGVRSSW